MITANVPRHSGEPPPGSTALAPIVRDVVDRGAELWRFIWRHSILIVASALTAGIAAYAGSFLITEEFRSAVTFFVDRSGRSMSLPSGLASLGRSLGVGDLDEGQPLDFYAWLATSDGVLRSVLSDTVPQAARRPGRKADVWSQVLNKEAPTDSVAWAKGLAMLREKIRAEVITTTGTVNISGAARTRPLSQWLTQRVFESVNAVNTDRRRSRATNELQFLRERERAAATSLRDAEASLTGFYSANRQSPLPPNLRNIEERLRRQTELSRELYLSLAKSAQDAEIRAVRDLPALTVISGPTMPLRRSKPRRLLLAGLAAVLAGALALGWAWWREAQATA